MRQVPLIEFPSTRAERMAARFSVVSFRMACFLVLAVYTRTSKHATKFLDFDKMLARDGTLCYPWNCGQASFTGERLCLRIRSAKQQRPCRHLARQRAGKLGRTS